HGEVERDVDAPAALRRGSVEVDFDLAGTDADRDDDLDALTDAVRIRLAAVDARRQAGNAFAHRPLGPRLQVLAHGVQVGQPGFPENLVHAPLHQHVGRVQRLHVALHLVRQAGVRADDEHQVFVDLPGPEDVARRDVQPLFVGVSGVGTGLAAQVRYMGDAPGVPDEAALPEDRADQQ